MLIRFLLLVAVILPLDLAFSRELSSKALFVSVIQEPPVLTSPAAIKGLVSFAQDAHIDTLFVQVYYAGRAWFPSRIVSKAPLYVEARHAFQEEPLSLLIKEAHARGIKVHAWINLMSLGSNADAYFLRKYGPGILTCNLEPKSKITDYKIDSQYFLEPGDPRVRRDLSKIVKEILHFFPDLDGIQFDYIRYPDPKPHYGYNKFNIKGFLKKTGLLKIDDGADIWKEYKRQQVTETLKTLVHVVRSMRPGMLVSTTGCMPYPRAYQEAFQNWPDWINGGLIDFVTIMDYSVDLVQFTRWINMIRVITGDFSKVKISVGAYKLVANPEVFKAEFTRCQEMGAGCAVFHYGSVLENEKLVNFLKESPEISQKKT